MNVDSRVWLITGASSGWGRAIAEAALAAGDTVVSAVRAPAAVAGMAAAHPGRVTVVGFDVTDGARTTAVVNEAIDVYGRIDVLVNSAGRALVGAVEKPATINCAT